MDDQLTRHMEIINRRKSGLELQASMCRTDKLIGPFLLAELTLFLFRHKILRNTANIFRNHFRSIREIKIPCDSRVFFLLNKWIIIF